MIFLNCGSTTIATNKKLSLKLDFTELAIIINLYTSYVPIYITVLILHS